MNDLTHIVNLFYLNWRPQFVTSNYSNLLPFAKNDTPLYLQSETLGSETLEIVRIGFRKPPEPLIFGRLRTSRLI